MKRNLIIAGIVLAILLAAISPYLFQAEKRNQLARKLMNWTGADGVLEVYSGGKLVCRFLKISKVSPALGTDDGLVRPYRYGTGILDVNLNGVVDPGEEEKYFEISAYSTEYVFYGKPSLLP